MKTTKELDARAYQRRKRHAAERNLAIQKFADKASILSGRNKKPSRYEKELGRRLFKCLVEKLEWQLTKDKVSFIVVLTLIAFLVLIVGIVLVSGNLSGGTQISLITAYSAIVAAMLRHFQNLIDRR